MGVHKRIVLYIYIPNTWLALLYTTIQSIIKICYNNKDINYYPLKPFHHLNANADAQYLLFFAFAIKALINTRKQLHCIEIILALNSCIVLKPYQALKAQEIRA